MIKIYDDWQEARKTVLRRRNLDWDDAPAAVRQGIRRVFGQDLTPQQAAQRIVADVRQGGDQAVRDWTARTDGVTLESLEVPRERWQAAYESLPHDLTSALDLAAERVRAFHIRQPIASWTTGDLGGTLGQRVTPLASVGVYVPGGTAPLPSSLLMAAIPARVAGVPEVVVCTPPDREKAGQVPEVILAAAHCASVDRVYSIGGAQAIAALAFGTQSIPRVDKIVGAGGLFVTLAKRLLYGQVGLDGLYGPTETVIIADDSANAAWVAADLLAQAEHDVLATAILLTPSRPLAEQVQSEVNRQLGALSRKEMLHTSLQSQGGIVVTPDLRTAVQLADEFAPEHLCLSLREPDTWAGQVRNAGGLFLGEHSCEVLGDYVAGPSHIMPTGGTARFASPLTVLDFVRITSIVALDGDTAELLCGTAARLARAESLTGHAAAAHHRGEARK